MASFPYGLLILHTGIRSSVTCDPGIEFREPITEFTRASGMGELNGL